MSSYHPEATFVFFSPLQSFQYPHYFFSRCPTLIADLSLAFVPGLSQSPCFQSSPLHQDSFAIVSFFNLETVFADTSAAYVGLSTSCSRLVFLACLFLPTVVVYLSHTLAPVKYHHCAFALGFPSGHFLQLKHVHSQHIPTNTFFFKMILAYLR